MAAAVDNPPPRPVITANRKEFGKQEEEEKNKLFLLARSTGKPRGIVRIFRVEEAVTATKVLHIRE